MVFGLGDLFKDKVFVSGTEEAKEYGKKYIIAKDGVYICKENEFFDYQDIVEEFNQPLRLGEEGRKIRVKERIPIEILIDIMAYYRYVDKKYKTEASALIFYNHNGVEIDKGLQEEYGESIREYGKFVLLIPHHYASSGYTSFYDEKIESRRDKAHGWMCKNMIKVMQTHSHNSMRAFWSGTDNRFEEKQFNCLYLVMGNVNTETPTYRFRTVFNNVFYNLDGKMSSGDLGIDLGDLTHEFITTMDVKYSYLMRDWETKQMSLQEAFNFIDFDNYMDIPEDWLKCLNYYQTKSNATNSMVDMNMLYVQAWGNKENEDDSKEDNVYEDEYVEEYVEDEYDGDYEDPEDEDSVEDDSEDDGYENNEEDAGYEEEDYEDGDYAEEEPEDYVEEYSDGLNNRGVTVGKQYKPFENLWDFIKGN